MQRGRKRAEFLWNESTYGISSISYSYRFYYLEGLYYTISLKKKKKNYFLTSIRSKGKKVKIQLNRGNRGLIFLNRSFIIDIFLVE